MSDQGIVVGIIHPAKDDGKPLFEIIRRDDWRTPNEEVRPCDHSRFVLDEKWATVTCQACGAKVDPFAALLWYARRYEDVRREYQRVREAEKSLHREELRRLSKLRDIADDEAEEIRRLLAREHERTTDELKEAAYRIRRAINDRKMRRWNDRRRRKIP